MGGKKSENQIIDYTRSGSYWNIFGREFESRRLHQIVINKAFQAILLKGFIIFINILLGKKGFLK